MVDRLSINIQQKSVMIKLETFAEQYCARKIPPLVVIPRAFTPSRNTPSLSKMSCRFIIVDWFIASISRRLENTKQCSAVQGSSRFLERSPKPVCMFSVDHLDLDMYIWITVCEILRRVSKSICLLVSSPSTLPYKQVRIRDR